MTNVGITGHRRIPDEALDHVTREIGDVLRRMAGPIVGYSSLAIGADQIFAQTVLDTGGELVAVIPCREYETTFAPSDVPAYESLLARATITTILDYPAPTDEAYMAAGEQVVENSDIVIAVWDGLPANGLGGTGDAVRHARNLGKSIIVIWSEGVYH